MKSGLCKVGEDLQPPQSHEGHVWQPFAKTSGTYLRALPCLLCLPTSHSPLQVCHELVVLEKLHLAPEFSPAASLEALTKQPLRVY